MSSLPFYPSPCVFLCFPLLCVFYIFTILHFPARLQSSLSQPAPLEAKLLILVSTGVVLGVGVDIVTDIARGFVSLGASRRSRVVFVSAWLYSWLRVLCYAAYWEDLMGR